MGNNNNNKKLVSITPVNDYVTIQPALDFFNGQAIVSIGAKWLYRYTDDSVEFETRPYCIMSNGDKFGYTKLDLANRCLFHTGHIDIPEARWSFDDIEEFSQERTCPSFEEIYNVIRNEFETYMEFSDERLYSLFTVFCIYSYFYPLFNNAPIIQLWGEFKTGKTKVCSLIDAMAFNPINSANISSASVFRLIESRRAVIILDESEDLLTSERARDIRNMLLAGTGKSGETFRQEKGVFEQFHTQSFKVFGPKIIANIAGIDLPALQSRVIRAIMIGTADKVKANRVVSAEDPKWQKIRNLLYRACLTRYLEVMKVRDELPRIQLTGRAFGMWQGILTLAKLVDEDTYQELLTYARDNKLNIDSEIEEFSDEPMAMLNELLKIANPDGANTYITPDELMAKISLQFSITSKRDLAFKMGRFGLHTRVLYVDGKYNRYYVLVKHRIEEIKNAKS